MTSFIPYDKSIFTFCENIKEPLSGATLFSLIGFYMITFHIKTHTPGNGTVDKKFKGADVIFVLF